MPKFFDIEDVNREVAGIEVEELEKANFDEAEILEDEMKNEKIIEKIPPSPIKESVNGKTGKPIEEIETEPKGKESENGKA